MKLWRGKVLIEKTESHVVIFLLLFFLDLGSSCRSSSSSSSWGGSCSWSSSTSWHTAQLALAFLNQLLNVLASQLIGNHLNFLIISINANRAKNLLDVGG